MSKTDAIAFVNVAFASWTNDQGERVSFEVDDIPEDASFYLCREVEYFADRDCSPDYARPDGEGWERTGDDEPMESEWCGSDQMVRAYRWEKTVTGLDALWGAIRETCNDSPHSWEPLAGMLADFGDGPHTYPCAQRVNDGMDWNRGGWTPVFIGADYLTIFF